MVAVPIIVGDKKIPWGVAAATSNRAYHFNIYPVDGVATAEPARAIAAMAALTVKAVMSGSIPQEGPTADRKEPKS
jgi:hypothetical protein